MGDEWIAVPREAIRETMKDLKEQGYHSYVFMTCVDHLATPLVEPPPERFELVHQRGNMKRPHVIRVRVYLPESHAGPPSFGDFFGRPTWDKPRPSGPFRLPSHVRPRAT